ncbi:MAG: hypothetical protein GY750_11660 [Lentisphaerae bacterium]|nr:hypothetical protein [Lentisphaerota bacterium]MCP4102071.1 hypothetical protein [Lentisphaerota bacterium]
MRQIYPFNNQVSTTKGKPKGVCFASNFLQARRFLNGKSIYRKAPSLSRCIHLQALYNHFGGSRLLTLFHMTSDIYHEKATSDFNEIYNTLDHIKNNHNYGYYLIGMRFGRTSHMVGVCYAPRQNYFFDSNRGLFHLDIRRTNGLRDLIRFLRKYSYMSLNNVLFFKFSKLEDNYLQPNPDELRTANFKYDQARNRSLAQIQETKREYKSLDQWRYYKNLEKFIRYIDEDSNLTPHGYELKTLLRSSDLGYHSQENSILYSDYLTKL